MKKTAVAILIAVLAAIPPVLEAAGRPEIANVIRELVVGAGLCPQVTQ